MDVRVAKSFSVTVNNWTQEQYERLLGLRDVARIVIGKEVGAENQTPHLQCAVTFFKAKRVKALRKMLPGAHIEVARAVESLFIYCKKGGDFYEKDARKGQGKRFGMREACELVRTQGMQALIDDMPEFYVRYHTGFGQFMSLTVQPRDFKTEVWYIYGPTGCGKTRWVMDQVRGTSYYFQSMTDKWWCGFTGMEESVIIDDLRDTFCNFVRFLQLIDRYPCTVEVKGGSRQFAPKKIYITAPCKPESIWAGTSEDMDQLKRRIDHLWNMGRFPGSPRESGLLPLAEAGRQDAGVIELSDD